MVTAILRPGDGAISCGISGLRTRLFFNVRLTASWTKTQHRLRRSLSTTLDCSLAGVVVVIWEGTCGIS